MQYLEEERARQAVRRTMGGMFVVPDRGERVSVECVEFDLIRRGETLDAALRYRVRLEDGVVYGSFVGGEVGR